jgi:hypothetical protein
VTAAPFVVRTPEVGYTAGTLVSFTVTYRFLELGLEGSTETQLLQNYRLAIGLVGGIGMMVGDFLKLEALGEAGAGGYLRVNAGLFNDGGSGAEIYYGGRAGVLVRLCSSCQRAGPSIGAWGIYSNDTARTHVTYTYTGQNWFNGASYPTTGSATIGTERLGVALGVSVVF